MVNTSQCLLDYLTAENCIVDPSFKRGKNTTNDDWVTIREVRSFADFDWAMVEERFGALLRKPFPKADLDQFMVQKVEGFPLCSPKDEDSLEHLLGMQIQAVVNKALKWSHTHSAENPTALATTTISMARGGQADDSSRFKPDWAGCSLTNTRNLLPGDSKISQKWASSMIQQGNFEDNMAADTARWMWPLRQIATYCAEENRRYGYLITDQEVVAIRVRLENSSSTRIDTLEYRSIPWVGRSPDGMTINLALWALHMLASYSDSSLQMRYPSLKELNSAVPLAISRNHLSSSLDQEDCNSDDRHASMTTKIIRYLGEQTVEILRLLRKGRNAESNLQLWQQ